LADYTEQELTDELLRRMGEKARTELLSLPHDDPNRQRYLEERADFIDRLRRVNP
jgi:hypothetical protein